MRTSPRPARPLLASLAHVTERAKRSDHSKLEPGTRVAACLGVGGWLLTMLSFLSESYALAIYEGEPVYHAAHDMIPPDAVTKLMGYLLTGISGVLTAVYVLLMISLTRGVRPALYAASFLAMLWIWTLVKSGPPPGWQVTVLLCSSALVLCSAAFHWFRSHVRSKQT